MEVNCEGIACMQQRQTVVCDECKSLYYAESSKMAALCPNAHTPYMAIPPASTISRMGDARNATGTAPPRNI